MDPPNPYVGQRVIHEIALTGVEPTSRIEWLVPPAFPDLRAVRLPPMPGGHPAGSAAGSTTGTAARRVRRALWAARSGEIRLPEASYRCTSEGGDTGVFETPRMSLQVRPIPDRGRPPGWRGLVGITRLVVHLSEPRARHVVVGGEPLELRAVATGPGHMRRARIVWPVAELENQPVAPELFFLRPQVMSGTSGPGLLERATSVLDIVPHEPGELRVPPVTVAYFDPDSGTFEEARSEAFHVEIRPEEVYSSGHLSQQKTGRNSENTPGASWRTPTAWIVGCVVLAGFVVRFRRGSSRT